MEDRIRDMERNFQHLVGEMRGLVTNLDFDVIGRDNKRDDFIGRDDRRDDFIGRDDRRNDFIGRNNRRDDVITPPWPCGDTVHAFSFRNHFLAEKKTLISPLLNFLPKPVIQI